MQCSVHFNFLRLPTALLAPFAPMSQLFPRQIQHDTLILQCESKGLVLQKEKMMERMWESRRAVSGGAREEEGLTG